MLSEPHLTVGRPLVVCCGKGATTVTLPQTVAPVLHILTGCNTHRRHGRQAHLYRKALLACGSAALLHSLPFRHHHRLSIDNRHSPVINLCSSTSRLVLVPRTPRPLQHIIPPSNCPPSLNSPTSPPRNGSSTQRMWSLARRCRQVSSNWGLAFSRSVILDRNALFTQARHTQPFCDVP
jgi:hypothetical protein